MAFGTGYFLLTGEGEWWDYECPKSAGKYLDIRVQATVLDDRTGTFAVEL